MSPKKIWFLIWTPWHPPFFYISLQIYSFPPILPREFPYFRLGNPYCIPFNKFFAIIIGDNWYNNRRLYYQLFVKIDITNKNGDGRFPVPSRFRFRGFLRFQSERKRVILFLIIRKISVTMSAMDALMMIFHVNDSHQGGFFSTVFSLSWFWLSACFMLSSWGL